MPFASICVSSVSNLWRPKLKLTETDASSGEARHPGSPSRSGKFADGQQRAADRGLGGG